MSSYDGHYDRALVSFDGATLIELDHLKELCLVDAVGLLDGDDLTGLMLWPASSVLAELLLIASPQLYCNVNAILELGAGSGLPGLCVGKSQSKVNVVLSDAAPSSVELLTRNVDQNGMKSRCNAMTLCWGDEGDEDDRDCNLFDVLIGADVIYEVDAVALLFRTVDKRMADDGVFVLTYTERLAEFTAAVRRAVDVHKLACSTVHECESQFGQTFTLLFARSEHDRFKAWRESLGGAPKQLARLTVKPMGSQVEE
jgi:predicted nicotinamide N-methyase